MVLALVLVVLSLIPIIHVEWQVHEARNPATAISDPVAQDPPDARPVLILLHGAGLNGHMWDAVRRSLDPAYRVVAPDLPGHGADREGTYTLEGARGLIAAEARAVFPSPVILVGDSLGGYSAMAAASAIPASQLKGVVIAGSSGNFKGSKLSSYVGGLLLVRALLLFNDENRLAERALGNFPLSQADDRAMIAAGVNLRAVAPAARSLFGVDFRAKVAAIDAPVLIVNGTLDRNAVDQEQSFLAAAKHGTLLHFDNCEHGVSMRRPAEFAAAVNAFTARVTQKAP